MNNFSIDTNEIQSLKYFADAVDEESWKEFMPKELKPGLFKKIVEKFFDEDVVLGARMRTRKHAKQADELLPNGLRFAILGGKYP